MEGNLKNNSYNLQVQKLKRYVQFSKEEEKLLARLKKILAPDVTKFVEDFYKHLLHFQETKKLLDQSGSLERLKKTQTQYFLSLFQGKYSREYCEQRLKIGLAHEKIGLSPQWYLGAYGLYYQNLFSQIVSAYKNSPSRIKKAIIALSKLLLLDMQVAMEAYMGKALEEFKIKGLEDLMPDFYKPRGMRHIQDVIETGFGELEAVFVSKEGKELQLEISSTALYNSSGKFLKARSCGRDVTERNKLEQQLLKWERLATVGSMSAKVAHEIKNPLSALSLNLELLEDEVDSYLNVDSKEAKTLFASISSELERLTTLTDEHLQFPRLPKQTPELINLSELVQRLIPLMGAELHRRGIRLSLQIPHGLPLLEGEKNQLLQVFINLLRNAEEAMPNGGSITISASQEDSFLQVRGKDTGSGIAAEDLPNIFDPFYTTKDTGTGLGLSFVQPGMREMQGKVTCESEKRKGSTFILYFPVKGGEADD